MKHNDNNLKSLSNIKVKSLGNLSLSTKNTVVRLGSWDLGVLEIIFLDRNYKTNIGN